MALIWAGVAQLGYRVIRCDSDALVVTVAKGAPCEPPLNLAFHKVKLHVKPCSQLGVKSKPTVQPRPWLGPWLGLELTAWIPFKVAMLQLVAVQGTPNWVASGNNAIGKDAFCVVEM